MVLGKPILVKADSNDVHVCPPSVDFTSASELPAANMIVEETITTVFKFEFVWLICFVQVDPLLTLRRIVPPFPTPTTVTPFRVATAFNCVDGS